MPVLTHSVGTILCQTCTLCSFMLPTVFSLSMSSIQDTHFAPCPALRLQSSQQDEVPNSPVLGQVPAGEPLSSLVLLVKQKDAILTITHLCFGELTQCSTRTFKLPEIAYELLRYCADSQDRIFFTEKWV